MLSGSRRLFRRSVPISRRVAGIFQGNIRALSNESLPKNEFKTVDGNEPIENFQKQKPQNERQLDLQLIQIAIQQQLLERDEKNRNRTFLGIFLTAILGGFGWYFTQPPKSKAQTIIELMESGSTVPTLEAVLKDDASEDKPVTVDKPEVAVNTMRRLMSRSSQTLNTWIMHLFGIKDEKEIEDAAKAEVVVNKIVPRDDIVNALMPEKGGDYKIIFGPKGAGKSAIARLLARKVKEKRNPPILYVEFFDEDPATYQFATNWFSKEPTPFKRADMFEAFQYFKKQGKTCVVIVDGINYARDDIIGPWIAVGKNGVSDFSSHVYLFTSTGEKFKEVEKRSDCKLARPFYVPDMTKEQSFELLGKIGILGDADKQEIYDQVGGRPGYLKEFDATNTPESRQAVKDVLNKKMETDFGKLVAALDRIDAELKTDLKPCLSIVINAFMKVKQDKLNMTDRTFSRFRDIKCKEEYYPKLVAQSGNVFRLTGETEVAVDSIPMEAYIQSRKDKMDSNMK